MTPTEPVPALGIRERKRRAVRRAIQIAAIESVESSGMAGATIEVISRRAGISPRTFFNHFPSKDSALLGEEWRPLTPAAVDDFVDSRGAIVIDLGRLLLSLVNTDGLSRDLVRRRLRLAEQHTSLAGIRVRWIATLESELQRAIARRIDAEHPHADAALRARATSLLSSTAVSAFRSAWAWWAENGDEESLFDDIVLAFSLLESPARILSGGQP